jgi:hypothetical protein
MDCQEIHVSVCYIISHKCLYLHCKDASPNSQDIKLTIACIFTQPRSHQANKSSTIKQTLSITPPTYVSIYSHSLCQHTAKAMCLQDHLHKAAFFS